MGIVRYNGNNNRPLKFSGFQLELGTRASTPIITTGAAATVGADNLALGGLTDVLAGAFSVVVTADPVTPSDGHYPTIVGVSSGTSANLIAVYRSPTNNRFTSQIFASGVSLSQANPLPASYAGPVKIAFAFDGTTLRCAVSGSLHSQPLPAAFTAPLSILHGFGGPTGNSQIKAVGRSISLFPYALTDAELVELTR